ncbi:MAG: rod shape-determining protein [Candidatus Kaiserbacteria bacterium]|nr:rod shape-determining protein [Candidatus Kaiserbacteria bacterium]
MANTAKEKREIGSKGLDLLQKQKLYQRVVLGRKPPETAQARQPKAPPKKKTTPVLRAFGNHIGIDLGTATTVVYVEGKGVVMREPTLVAVNRRTDQVVAMGKRARQMIGRTPEHIEVIQPIQLGVINDYEITEQLFEHIFRKVQDASPKIFSPSVIIGVPCCTSQAEINAVRDAVIDAGARRVGIVYEPFAAAVGIDLPLVGETAVMVIDIGGGTSDTMILAGGEIVASDSIRLAGDAFDKAIVEGLREKKQIIIGERTAEDLKVATMQSANEQKVFSVQGRSSSTGLPLEADVSFDEIVRFLDPCLGKIVEYVGTFVGRSSPEVQADLKNNNIYFVGGGPAIHAFPRKIEEALNLRIVVPENATGLVARGTALIAQSPEQYEKYFLS